MKNWFLPLRKWIPSKSIQATLVHGEVLIPSKSMQVTLVHGEVPEQCSVGIGTGVLTWKTHHETIIYVPH